MPAEMMIGLLVALALAQAAWAWVQHRRIELLGRAAVCLLRRVQAIERSSEDADSELSDLSDALSAVLLRADRVPARDLAVN
jgi:hypothetical protein